MLYTLNQDIIWMYIHNFAELNKKAIGYQGGDGKSLEALGFLAKDKIPIHYLCGDGSMIFMPIDDDAVNMSNVLDK